MGVSYASVPDVKELLPDSGIGTHYDTLLINLLERASRLVDAFTGWGEGAFAVSSSTSKLFDGSGLRILYIDELAEFPPVSVEKLNGASWTSIDLDGLMSLPNNSLPKIALRWTESSGKIWEKGEQNYRIVGKFGFSTTVPPIVKQAVIIQTIRWFKRGQQAFQDVGVVSDLGQLRYVQKMDPEIEMLLISSGLKRIAV